MQALCSPIVCTLDADGFLQQKKIKCLSLIVECLTKATEYFRVHLLNIICLLPRQRS